MAELRRRVRILVRVGIVLALFLCSPAFAQPVITSISPASATAGASVTVTGTSFSATTGSNTVYFGATQATVTAASTTSLTATVPTGATFGPISVTVANLTAFSKQFFLPTFTGTGPTIDASNLAAKVDFTTGTGPIFVVAGDVDGDGKADLVVSNYGANTVSVFRNTSTSGTISGGSFAAKVDFATGTGPCEPVLVDVDGDGKLDVAVTSNGSNTVSVFLNTSSGAGSVSFAGKVDFTASAGPNRMTMGDVDGDGKPDLVVANYGSAAGTTVSVFLNTSSGAGSVSFASKVDFTTGTAPAGVRMGDIDGDGKEDLVIANFVSSSVSVLRNTSSGAGAVSFAAKADFTTGANPQQLAVGDVDGDGKLDLAVTSETDGTVSVLRNTSTSGSITLATKVDFTAGTNTFGVAIGDLDGDGKPEVSVTNWGPNTVSVFRNTSTSGTINSSSLAAKVDFSAGTTVQGIALADLDGDGRPEVAVANYGSNNVSVFRNLTLTAPLPTITAFTPTSANVGASVTITGTNLDATANNNTVFFGATKATVTAATTTSLTATVPVGATFGPISVTVANRTAISKQFFLPTFTGTGSTIDASNLAAKVDFATGTAPYNVAVGDVDGDGKPDLAVANFAAGSGTAVSVFRNTGSSGTASFSAKVDFTAGAGPTGVALGDLDGDGKLDLIAANNNSTTISVFRNTSTSGTIDGSSFAAKVDFTAGTNPYIVAVVDVDGDGKPDLAVTNFGSATLSVFRNTSSPGVIDATSFAAKVDFTTGNSPVGVAAGDLDGDGKPDLVAAAYTGNVLSVFRNTSSPGAIDASSFAAKVDFTTGTTPVYVVIGDVDGDGKSELAVANYGSATLSVFRNTASSGVINGSSFATKVDFATGTNPSGVALGDLDGDGKLDVATANFTTNNTSVFRNTSTSGTIALAAKEDFATGSGPLGMAMGDVDGDGKTDLAVANNSAGTLSVLRNLTQTAPLPTITAFTPTSANVGASVTITGTNFSATPGNNTVFFGATKATVTAATTTSLTATVPTGATFGPVSVQVSNLTAYSKQFFLPTFTATVPEIAPTSLATHVDFTAGTGARAIAKGDLDGDGKADVAVANYTSGTVSVYRNTGSSGSVTFATKVDLATGSNPTDVEIGDVDGDGKPDLVVPASGAAMVSVFRNTSTSGSIAFATRADFSTATGSQSAAIVDLNGDGWPELAVANPGANSLSVLRNTGFPGLVAFAAKVDFTTGTTPASVAAGDVDGDGTPDLVVTDSGANTVSVFRNTSTLGTITMAARVSFATAAQTADGEVALGDVDGDGKVEVVVSCFTDDVLSVLRNTSTSGTVSLAAKVDFATADGPTGVSLGDVDGDGKPEIAVDDDIAWSVSLLRNTSSSGTINSSSFASQVYFTAGQNPFGVVIADLDGDGKPEIATANFNSANFSVLRNQTYTAALPTITSFTPTSAAVGASVTITGTNFSATTGNNTVFFGATKATVTAASTTSLTATVPVGATFGPISLTVANRTAISKQFFLPTFSATVSGIDPTSFAAKADLSAETSQYNMATGDLDGDGKTDLAVTNFAANTVSVYRNISTTGTVSPSSFDTKVDLATATGPTGVVLGDVDGDGKLDLSVTDYSAAKMSVFRNTSTSGTISFAAKVDFTTGTNPVGLGSGDLDGDGKPDLAVANSGSTTISVFRNTSTSGAISSSSFAPKVDFATATSPQHLVLGDVDGDGKADLVAPNYGSNSVSVLRNTGGPGTVDAGSFAAKVDFTTGGNPFGMVMGDVDGDGKFDIAVTNVAGNTLSVLRNTSTSGTVTLAAKVDFTTGTGPYQVAMGDVDGDGKPDLAVSNFDGGSGTNVSMLRNTSTSGTIALAPKADFTTGAGPVGLAIVDVDGAGKPEVAVANNGVAAISLFRNQTYTAPLPTITSFTPTSANVGASVTITGTNFSATTGNNTVFFGATKATVTAASTTSLTVTVPAGATFGPLTVTVANRTAASRASFLPTFTPVSSGFGGTSLAAKVDFAAGGYTHGVEIGDLDGDGKPDLVTNPDGQKIAVYQNTGAPGAIGGSSFAAHVDFNAGTSDGKPKVADVDGDGKLDIVLPSANGTLGLVSVFRNIHTSGAITTSSFAAKVDFTAGSYPSGVAFGDLDGDGRPDMVVVSYGGGANVSVYRNSSVPGAFSASSFAAPVNFATGGGNPPVSVAVGDLNGDGKPEIIAATHGNNNVSVFPNTATPGVINASSFATAVSFATGTQPDWVVIADVDGDGQLELITSNYTSSDVSVLRNIHTSGAIAAGSFAANVDYAAVASATNHVSVGDLNGDGKPDLAVVNYNAGGAGTLSVFRNTSTQGTIDNASFAAKVNFAAGNGSYGLALGDLDGDGKPEAVVATNNETIVSVFRNLDPTFLEVGGAAGVGAVNDGVGAAWGDYDNDGDPDLFRLNTSNQSDKLYRNNNDGTFSDLTSTAGLTDSADGRGAAWGDYDNDGDLDLYLANISSPDRLYRNNNNGTFAEVAAAAGVNDNGVGVAVAWGDYDRDGLLDLYLTKQDQPNLLYHNNGNGTFTNTAAAAGVNGNATARGAAWGDCDNDGDLDLYVANFGQANWLYRNNGTGTFAEVGAAAGVNDAGSGSGAAWADYDNDGDLDLYLANYGQANRLFRNSGGGVFTEVGASAGVNDAGNGNGLAWGDYDSDGDLDLFLVNAGSPNRLYRNNGDGTFAGVGAAAGVGQDTGGIGATFADYDNDGDLDLHVVNFGSASSLYRNNGNTNRWLKLKLAGTNSNKTGVGARVSATAAGITQRRDLDGGSGYLSQPPQTVMFGFGATTTVSQLSITRPSGVVQTLSNQATNQTLSLTDVVTPTQVVFTTQPGDAVPGQPLGVQPVVELRDSNGQKALGFTGVVSLTPGSGGVLSGPATVAAVNGVATFSGLSFSGAGTRTLRASAAGLSGTSDPFVMTKAPASITLINLGASFNGQPQVAGVTTNPPGLSVGIGYNGSGTPPAAPGIYAVVATITDPNFAGSSSGEFIRAVRRFVCPDAFGRQTQPLVAR